MLPYQHNTFKHMSLDTHMRHGTWGCYRPSPVHTGPMPPSHTRPCPPFKHSLPRVCPAVRALQLGLTSVPRVDARCLRPLRDYTRVYREWLLLLRGRLQAQDVELPPEVGRRMCRGHWALCAWTGTGCNGG